MSTCPSEDLYCAFVDDEVPPILKKEIELHLSQCKKCRKICDRYKFLKDALVCDEIPSLDLNQSFEKLLLKRNSVKRRSYDFFPAKLKYKVLASAVAGVFLFVFSFVLVRHNSAYDKAYNLHKGEVQFTPIVPMSYRQHNNIINNIDLHEMTSIVKTDKKYNKRICKNFTNTFNSFSCLYTSLERNTDGFLVTMPNVNEELHHNYRMSMPVYANLNKDVR